MDKIFTVIFDGETLHPESPVDLVRNMRYRIVIQEELPLARSADAWAVLTTAAGTVDAPEDWAEEHDHYLYGTPKRVEDHPRNGS